MRPSSACSGCSRRARAIRAFVAALLDSRTRAALGGEIDRLRPIAHGVAWVPADNLHITLRFLGQVDDARADGLGAVLGEATAGVRRFDLEITGLGAFPSPTRARVIWAGAGAGSEALGTVARRVEEGLARVGFPPEARPFTAHVTLGRVREPRRDPALASALAAGAGRAFGRPTIDRICLMRSDLSPRGARYTEITAAPLGP